MNTRICKTCDTEFSGNYCNNCGEKVISQEDRKFKYYLGEFINALTFADNKLWRTLKTILISPGKLSSEFVEGRRKNYMKPVSIFFLANLIYFLFPVINTFTTSLQIQMSGLPYSEIVNQWVVEEVAERGIKFEEYEKIYNTKTTELSKLLLTVMATLIGFFLWPIHIGSKRNLLADQMTIGQEVMTFILIFCLQLLAGLILIASLIGIKHNLFSDVIISTLSCIMLLFFFAKVEYQFYGFRGFRLVINTILSLLTVIIALFLYRAILFFVTFWAI
ncbi:DUF3667 domain-containing protein [Ekhidna sp. To15]|uniref:DUF3667 domain-containing protein n=1 Tax=Ekhidna sp. To15 TaxID=3395267 RepID=UPI003F525B48